MSKKPRSKALSRLIEYLQEDKNREEEKGK